MYIGHISILLDVLSWWSYIDVAVRKKWGGGGKFAGTAMFQHVMDHDLGDSWSCNELILGEISFHR